MTYCWRCTTCGKEIAVSRPSKDIEKPPTKDEAGGMHPEWQRVLAAPPMVRGSRWTGRKGEW